jgi:hypothetical protein
MSTLSNKSCENRFPLRFHLLKVACRSQTLYICSMILIKDTAKTAEFLLNKCN